MLCVRINPSEFVIVKCNAGMVPIKFLEDITHSLGVVQKVECLFTSDVKDALRFDDVKDAMHSFYLIRHYMDDDFCTNLTIGRVLGNDDVLCLYI